MSSFGTARSILALIEFVGWAVVAIALIAGMVLGRQDASVGVAVALVGGFQGLLLVAMAQMGRATIVTAESTQGLLAEFKAANAATRNTSVGPALSAAATAPEYRHASVPPVNAPTHQNAEIYKGREIAKDPEGWAAAGRIFRSKMDARAYIDSLKR